MTSLDSLLDQLEEISKEAIRDGQPATTGLGVLVGSAVDVGVPTLLRSG